MRFVTKNLYAVLEAVEEIESTPGPCTDFLREAAGAARRAEEGGVVSEEGKAHVLRAMAGCLPEPAGSVRGKARGKAVAAVAALQEVAAGRVAAWELAAAEGARRFRQREGAREWHRLMLRSWRDAVRSARASAQRNAVNVARRGEAGGGVQRCERQGEEVRRGDHGQVGRERAEDERAGAAAAWQHGGEDVQRRCEAREVAVRVQERGKRAVADDARAATNGACERDRPAAAEQRAAAGQREEEGGQADVQRHKQHGQHDQRRDVDAAAPGVVRGGGAAEVEGVGEREREGHSGHGGAEHGVHHHGTHGTDLRQLRETRLSLRLGLLREESVGERSVRRTRVVAAYMRLVAQPATRRRYLRVRLRGYFELALGRYRDRRARGEAEVERERELERIGRERGDLVAARTRIARGEGGVRNYAEARPRAANGAKAVAVRSGRRTTRVSELVGRMLGNLCRRAKEAG